MAVPDGGDLTDGVLREVHTISADLAGEVFITSDQKQETVLTADDRQVRCQLFAAIQVIIAQYDASTGGERLNNRKGIGYPGCFCQEQHRRQAGFMAASTL